MAKENNIKNPIESYKSYYFENVKYNIYGYFWIGKYVDDSVFLDFI